MQLTPRFLVTLCAASLCAALSLAVSASAQDASKKGKQLTARELFYAAVQSPAEEAKPRPEAKPARPKAPPRPDSPGPLGLRYTVLKFSGDTPIEVAPDTVFRSGDRVQLIVEGNSPGYLYVVSQGASGTWKPIFPSPEVGNGNNHVESLHRYTLPSEEHRMVFDETAGAEKLFLILSRQPEPDLEKIIYSLQGRPSPEPKQLVAGQNPEIDNSTVGRMRKAYARDLIIERVTPASPGETKETAVYVVNPTGSSNSRVVADLILSHR